MKFKFNLKILNIIISILLAIATITIVSSSTMIVLNSVVYNPEPKDAVLYKPGLVERFNISSDEDLKDFYKKNTKPICVKRKNLLSSYSLGTMWSYPVSENLPRYYFATAIHVVSDALLVKEFNNTNVDNVKLEFNKDFELSTVSEFLDEDQQISINDFNLALNDIRVEKVFTPQVSYYEKLSLSKKGNGLISDFIILSCSNNIKNLINNDYFINSVEEFNKAINSKEFYIGGYPYTELDYSFKSIKYINRKGYVKQNTSYRMVGKNNFISDKNIISKVKFLNDEEINFRSFTNLLLLKDLYFKGGMSGALITTKVDNKLKFIGITQGISINSINNKINSSFFNLFYTSSYFLTEDYKANGYNHNLIIPR